MSLFLLLVEPYRQDLPPKPIERPSHLAMPRPRRTSSVIHFLTVSFEIQDHIEINEDAWGNLSPLVEVIWGKRENHFLSKKYMCKFDVNRVKECITA